MKIKKNIAVKCPKYLCIYLTLLTLTLFWGSGISTVQLRFLPSGSSVIYGTNTPPPPSALFPCPMGS